MSGTEIIGVVAAAGQFVEQGLTIAKLVKSVLNQVQDGPDQIRQQLERLETLTSIAQQIKDTKTLQTENVKNILVRCESHAQSLEKLLQGIQFDKNDSLGRKTWRAVCGLTKEKEILELLDKLGAEHSSLNLEISLLNLKAGGTTAEAIQNGLASIEAKLSNIVKASDSSPDPVKCLRDLFVTDPFYERARLITAKGDVVLGTCDWVVQRKEFIQWQTSDGGLLWISGGPGLAALLNIFLLRTQNKNLNNATSIIRGLMFQLVQLQTELINHILPTYRIQGDRLFQTASFETIWEILLKMINDVGTARVSCILDGLDECNSESLKPLLLKLNNISDTAPRFRIIVMSREYPKYLGHSLGQFPRIRLDPDAKTEVNHGLEQYISARVEELAQKGQYPDELAGHVKKTLMEKSNGTYLWASFVIEDLRVVSISDVESHLNELPSGLDALYERILQQVDDGHKDLVCDILRWCTLAVRPLAPNELVAALRIEPTEFLDQDAILRGKLAYCGHFLSVTETAVTLVHQSAHDFLTRQPSNGERTPWFSLSNTEQEHSKLSSTCLLHIQNGRLENCYSPRMWKVPEPEELGYNFLPYAGTYWTYHLHLSGQRGADTLDEHSEFFSKNSPALEMWINWRLKSYERRRMKSFGNLSLSHIAVEFNLDALMQRILERDRWYMKDLFAALGSHGWTLLHNATMNGYLNIVQMLVQNGARIDAKGGNGRTPLYLAAENGHKEVVKYLLESGANPKGKNKDYRPLEVAMKSDHLEVVKLLLKWKADVNVEKEYENRLLRSAARSSSIFLLLLEHFATRFRNEPSVLRELVAFSYGRTALHFASEGGNIPAMRLLLDQKWGIDLNATDSKGETPLHIAVQYDRPEAIRLLLEQPGIDLNARDEDGETPLHYAAEHGGLQVVQLLLVQPGIHHNPVDNKGKTPLHRALRSSKASVVRLLAKEFHVPLPTTAIHLASSSDREALEKVQLLVNEFGVDPHLRTAKAVSPHPNYRDHPFWNEESSCYETPLSLAIKNEDEDVVEFLLAECNADPNAPCRGCDGAMPLHVAAENVRIEIVRTLITKWGADVNGLNDHLRTPLHLVANRPFNRPFNRLSKRPSMHAFGFLSKYLRNPFKNRIKDVIRTLLEAGAQISLKDSSGHTPRDLFASKRYTTRRCHEKMFDKLVAECGKN